MDLEALLTEAFHTYQVYLECNNMINDRQVKLSLLKWPDVVQSALGCIKAFEKNEISDLGGCQDVEIARKILCDDLIAAMIMPVKAIYDATVNRVEVLMDKPPLRKLEVSDDPIVLKNNYIVAINDMFKVLETMTAVKYPQVKKAKNGSIC